MCQPQAQQPTVAVIGASGWQGRAVVNSLLAQGSFRIAALFRNTDSDTARALANKGVEVRRADLTDLDLLVEAFKGCHGVFVSTDTHSAKGDPHEEFLYGKNASDAAKQAGVKHLVFSSLEDPAPGLTPDMPENKPGMQLAIFQVKKQIADYIQQHGPPATNLITSAFYENYFKWYNYMLVDGTYKLSTNVGTTPFAQNTVEDIGASCAVIFDGGEKYYGKDVPVVSQVMGMEEAMQIISQVTGKQVNFEAASDASIRALPYGWIGEPANMYQYFRTAPHYNGSRPKADQVVPGVPFREWAERNRDKLLQRLNDACGPDDSYLPFGAKQ